MSDPLLARPATFDLRADRFRVLIPGAVVGGRFSVVETQARQGYELPLHVHHNEDEWVLVLDGQVCVWVGHTEQRIAVGDALLLERGVPHALRLDTATARLLTIYSPAGFEGYLQAVARPVSPLQTPTAVGPPDVPRLVANAVQYGLEYFPTLPSLED